jgi:hypothetical protein
MVTDAIAVGKNQTNCINQEGGRVSYYQGCLLEKTETGYFVTFPSRNKLLLKGAETLEDCQHWIDRQLALVAIEQVYKGL